MCYGPPTQMGIRAGGVQSSGIKPLPPPFRLLGLTFGLDTSSIEFGVRRCGADSRRVYHALLQLDYPLFDEFQPDVLPRAPYYRGVPKVRQKHNI